MKRPHIPAETWRRIQAFFESGCTGDILLQIHKGKLRHTLVTERLEGEVGSATQLQAAFQDMRDAEKERW